MVLCTDTPEEIVCAKSASPLVLGLGDGGNLIASDVPAILPHTRRVIFLEEGDLAQLTRNRCVSSVSTEKNASERNGDHGRFWRRKSWLQSTLC